mmetsp:Transcript_939/g.1223  ORF Transcript_939/g.1223 Transcript_939/m.1223 type:complete len:208 (+) Transcript_939:203-826(+)
MTTDLSLDVAKKLRYHFQKALEHNCQFFFVISLFQKLLASFSSRITLHHKISLLVWTVFFFPCITFIAEFIHFAWVNCSILLSTRKTYKPQTLKTQFPNSIFFITYIFFHGNRRHKIKYNLFILGSYGFYHAKLPCVSTQIWIVRQNAITCHSIRHKPIHTNLIKIFGRIFCQLRLNGHTETTHPFHGLFSRNRSRRRTFLSTIFDN